MDERRIAAAVVACTLGFTVAFLPGSARAECAQGAAARFYADARHAFDEKRFDDSINLLRQASACDPNPVYLGNIARAYEEANRPKDALAAWRAYVKVLPDEHERQLTEGRISALSKVVADLERLEQEKRSAEDATRRAEAAARAPSPSPPRVVTGAWAVATAGAVVLLGGVVLGVLATSEHASAVQEPNVVRAETLQGHARSLAEAANITFIVGGVGAAIGVTWIAIDLGRKSASPLSVGLVTTGPGVSLVGRF